jgi:uncharacterized protein
MTPQERSLLENFLSQLAQVRGVTKDAEAERLIAQAVEQQPDATYLVVQRALLLGQALEQAKARIAALEQGEGRGQGFLDPNASGWGNQPGAGNAAAGYRGQVAPPGYGPQGAPAYAPGYGPQGYGAPPPGYPVYGGAAPGGGFSSFLGQAAATAAGVAGGEFLFQGIENMFGGHHGGGFAGGGYGGEDVTINNYYGPDEVVVDNNINQVQPDDSDATFSNDDVLGDDQDFV